MRLADLPGQPPPRLDHQGQRYPHDAALLLDAYLVGLHLSEGARWLDEMFLHRLTLHPSAREPTRHRLLVIAKRHDERLPWTTVSHPRHHEAHRLHSGPQAIEGWAWSWR
jgi:uncharacterized protein (DUF2236 family)